MSRTRRLAVVLTALVTWPCAGCAAQYGPVRDPSRGPDVSSVPRGVPNDHASPDSPSTAIDDGSATQRSRGHGRALRVAGWVSLGVGAEAAIIAAVTSVMLLHQKSVRDDDCDAHRMCSAAGLAANSTIDSLVAVNTVSWVVAAAGLGGGTLLLLTHPPDEKATAITLSPAGSGLGLGIRSSF